MTTTGHAPSRLALPPVLPTALIVVLGAWFARLYHWAGSRLLSPYAPREFVHGLLSLALLAATAGVLVVGLVGSVQ